jgi:hypothetical protein
MMTGTLRSEAMVNPANLSSLINRDGVRGLPGTRKARAALMTGFGYFEISDREWIA